MLVVTWTAHSAASTASPLPPYNASSTFLSFLQQPFASNVSSGTDLIREDAEIGDGVPDLLPGDDAFILTVVLSIMIAVTAVGNFLVCLSVYMVRRLRHPSNHLLVSLAVSDLCVALLVMPMALHYEVSGTWQLGTTLCDMWVSFDVTSCTASILNLCMISVDRYLAITRPLTYGVRRTARRIWLCIGVVWLISCLISVPPLLLLGNEHGNDEQPQCLVCQDVGYQLYATLGAFYIPLIVMIAMYYKIYVAAKRVVDAEHRAQVSSQQRPPSGWSGVDDMTCLKDGADNCNTTSSAVQRWQASVRKSSVLRERKASITLGIIMTAFTVCWLPFFVIALLRPITERVSDVPQSVQSFTLWLGYTNSMLNPVIYVTFHHDFRRAFRELLCCRCATINLRMREETYTIRQGSPTLHGANHFGGSTIRMDTTVVIPSPVQVSTGSSATQDHNTVSNRAHKQDHDFL